MNRAVRLHLRVLERPLVGVDELVKSCKDVFKQADVTIEIPSREELALSEDDQKRFTALKVFDSCSGKSVTSDQRALFALGPPVPPKGIRVYFVDSTDRATDGCAQHPSGKRGALVTRFCSEWTLAHELGHLLGLTHVSGPASRLMFDGTIKVGKGGVPALDKSEIDTILDRLKR